MLNGSLSTSAFRLFKTKFLHKGKLLYSLKKIFLLTKEKSELMSTNSVLYFYFLTKMHEFRQINHFRQAEKEDILIDSIQELNDSIARHCFIERSPDYKISIYTSKYCLMNSNSQLLSYKGDVLFAKVNQISDLSTYKQLSSPKISIPFSNKEIAHSSKSNDNNYSGVSNDRLIKNTLLKFRLDLTKISLKNNLTQKKCTKRYYPIREKKTLLPHLNSDPFKYHKYNFSFLDLVESSKEPPSTGQIKSPSNANISSHYYSFKKLSSNKKLRERCKYVFNPNLYPIDPESPSNSLSMSHSKSSKEMMLNRQLQNIHKYLSSKRRNGLFIHNNPETLLHFPHINSIKQEYSNLIFEFRQYIANHLEKAIKQSSLPLFSLSCPFHFYNDYPAFPFTQCQREFLFYSFVSYQFDTSHPGLLLSLKDKIDIKPAEVTGHINEYKDIVKDLIDNPIKIIHFAIRHKEIKLSRTFFQIFILCSDFFDRTQAALSDIMMMVLEANTGSHIDLKQFANYHLYFRHSSLLSKEKQFLFLKKIITYMANKSNVSNSSHDFCEINIKNPDKEEVEPMNNDSDHQKRGLLGTHANIGNSDIWETFRHLFQLNESLLSLLLIQYDNLNDLKVKRKQAKLDDLFIKVITYFNKR